MKRYLLLFCMVIAGLAACKKSEKFDAEAQAKLDDAQIVKYLSDSSIVATKDESGLYYQIITPGSASKPTVSNGIYITYEGKLMSTSAVFDTKTSPYYFASMTGLIQGWQIGVPKIGKGGRIKLFIPSGLAYKNEASGGVPANSVLIFDITLVDFN